MLFLFAWFQVTAGIQASTPISQVAVAKNADLGTKTLAAVWDGTGTENNTTHIHALKSVVLTNTSGESKVYNGSAFVTDTRNGLVKAETVTLTFDPGSETLTDVPGWYAVKVYGSKVTLGGSKYGLVRIGTQLSNGVVGSYTYGAGDSGVGEKITIGYINISATGVLKYADTKNGDLRGTGLVFYYSISPQYDETSASNLDDDSNLADYGSITAEFGNVE